MIFDEIKERRKVSGVCEKCGKRRSRIISDSQTVNPYNKNKDGLPKSFREIRSEVRDSVLKEANELREHFICATCSSS